MDVRQEQIILETERYRVEGNLTLPKEGHRSRLSDFINRREQEFFTIQDAELTAIDGSERHWTADVLMVARQHVRLIVPVSEGA